MKLQVIIADDIVARVDRLAKESGLSRSAFCNMLIADGVRSREASAALIDSLPDAFKDLLSNPVLLQEALKQTP